MTDEGAYTSFYWYWRERIDTLIIHGVWCWEEVALGKLPTDATTASHGELICMYIQVSIFDVAKTSCELYETDDCTSLQYV